MRVALVTSLVSPIRSAEANGPHAVVVDLARGLSRRGHQAIVYAAQGSAADGVDIVPIRVEPAAADAAVHAGRDPASRATKALNRGFERLFDRVRRDEPDVVSQHAFDVAAFELTEGLPTLHTLHLPPLSEEIAEAARRTRGSLATVSLDSQKRWEGATGRRVAVLRNGVRDLGPAVSGIMPIALVAGRISPEKGTDTAIRAARRAGLAVLVAGDAYDRGYHSRVVRPLLREGEWVGAVSREALFQLMARCAVLLMPIQWEEPFGLVAAEAQMAGCPVVAYRRGALPEVVADGLGGVLVEPGDEDALVRAVATARNLDRFAIRAHARRHLGVEQMVSAYEGELAEMVSSRAA